MSPIDSIETRLSELGIVLPTPPAPVASYKGFEVAGNKVYVSGQLPLENGTLLHPGKVGESVTLEAAQAAAKLCAINILAQLNAACLGVCGGDLSHVKSIIKLTGFVNCTPDYTDQPHVINAASDLMQAVFGEAGRHARAAVGVNALPLGAAVEIEAIAEIAKIA